jgi:hypothetical protein
MIAPGLKCARDPADLTIAGLLQDLELRDWLGDPAD